MNETLKEVILAYRDVIADRYQHEHLSKQYEIPESFTPKKIDEFREYFLTYVYPHPERRVELNDAFQSLDNYIKNPEKLLRLMVDSVSLIFKYGRQLPKILKAGLKALKSFRTASRFEKQLVQQANKLGLEAPFSESDINKMIAGLSQAEMDQFVENNQSLFEILYDRTLIVKIKEIVNHLIDKMRKRPKVYSAEEIRGLEIGRDIIVHGDQLFDQLSQTEQTQILDFTLQVERDVLKSIFS